MKLVRTLLKLVVASTLLLGQISYADSTVDDRLMVLIEKRMQLNAMGKDLEQKDGEEYDKLAEQKGFVGMAEIQNKIQSKVAAKAQPKSLTTQQKNAPISLIAPTKMTPSKDDCAPGDGGCLALIEARSAKTPSAKGMNPDVVGKTDLFEQKDMGAANTKVQPPVSKKEKDPVFAKELPKKKEILESVDPGFSKRMKKEVEEVSEMRKNLQDIKTGKATELTPMEPTKSGAIYDPIPSQPGVKQNGFYVERDSQSIITKRIGPKDAITVKMCIAYGVSITLDESIDTELQRIILDDKIFFDAQEFENKRGVYIRLLKPIPEGQRWDSAIRLVRKSDDKTYVVNLQAVACPDGQIDFPKVVYLKEKFDILSSKVNDVMTPEDMIIQVSQGLSRKNIHQVNVYDMVASPGSDWVVFGIEIQPPEVLSKPEKVDFSALDNLQINKLNVKTEFLKLQSEKATELRGKKVYRYKVMMAIDKGYILKNRFIHLVYVNKETNHYQYIQVDTLQYFQSLKDRGFDL
jgi:hypothetical protein